MSPIDSITDDELQALRDRVAELEQERDAALAGCAAWAAHNAIPSYQILDQHHTHFLGFKCKCCGGIGMKREAIAHAEDCNAKMGQPLLARLASAERCIEKLPLTADGVRVVPPLDPVFAPDGTQMVLVLNDSDADVFEELHSDPEEPLDVWYAMLPDEDDHRTGYVAQHRYERVCNCYSTESAALASKGGAS